MADIEDPGIPVVLDLERRRGDTFPLIITFRDKNSTANPKAPINITGFTFRWVCDSRKDPPDATTEVFDITGVIVGPGTDGTVSFSPTTLNVDNVGAFFHDIEWTDTASKVRTPIAGKLTFKQDRAK